MLAFKLSEEQELLKQTARDFTRSEIIPVAARYDEAEEFPAEIMRRAWAVGLMNFGVPREYDGLGLGVLDTILVLEEINYGCSGMGTTIAVNDLAVGDEYVLNGTKVFISNGSVANWSCVFAAKDRTMGHKGISCFVMDADSPGLSASKMRGKLGQRASDTAEIVFEECHIPKSALVGYGNRPGSNAFAHPQGSVGDRHRQRVLYSVQLC